IVQGAGAALDFYAKAFGAKVLFRMDQPDGRVGHAELQIGDSRLMLADEAPEMGAQAPVTLGGTPVSLLLYVPDVDARFGQAVAAGAKVTRPLEDKFYGDRMGSLEDPFGHQWHLASHVEDVDPEELQRRAAAQKG
ncbi:MAG TPA: VOC family protein, partial [Holophagaceae bacterium]|nr:VOC family protein [Holophagaceae bacterium]